MKYLLILLFSIALLLACSTTKVSKQSAPPKLLQGESLVLQMSGLPDHVSQQLFDYNVQKWKANEIMHFPDVKQKLAQKGIYSQQLSSADTAALSAIAAVLDARYLLSVEVLKQKKGSNVASYTERELNQYNWHSKKDAETHRAALQFSLTDTKAGFFTSTFVVTTSLNPLIVDKENGETRLNVRSDYSAVAKAFRKGIKHLQKNLVR